jgi:hypothetical protein
MPLNQAVESPSLSDQLTRSNKMADRGIDLLAIKARDVIDRKLAVLLGVCSDFADWAVGPILPSLLEA